MIQKILVANRGEIAVRIIRACKEMGIKTVAIYSSADKNALHTTLANEAICIGPARSKDSYLNMTNILSAACLTNADAIHPGFGFLSENSKFARLVAACGLIFIGPKPDVIDKMGNKSQAKKMMEKAGLPIIPGSKGNIEFVTDGIDIANKIGYPVLIKAANGGGGKGMRVANSDNEFSDAFYTAKAEALANFNNDEIYVEKLISNPKHVEVQVMADKFGNAIHLLERDCSIQRKKQKMIEESPCFKLRPEVRKKMYNDALKAVKFVGYDSVGTIEFLLDTDQNYYFMEMNTRVQVEHPVSEMVTNIDIIKHQIRIASNQKLDITQDDLKPLGYAMEVRINAEDIDNDFAPSPGKISFLSLPGGKGVRIDTAVYPGYVIPPYYDSMILKLITFAPTRLECIRKMRGALEELIIDGIKTNLDYQYMILHSTDFISGNYNTGFIENFKKELDNNGRLISRKKNQN